MRMLLKADIGRKITSILHAIDLKIPTTTFPGMKTQLQSQLIVYRVRACQSEVAIAILPIGEGEPVYIW